MTEEIVNQIIELVVRAQALAREIGIDNLLQPGLVKEMIVARQLKHRLIPTKRGADGCDPNDSTILYEYLSCVEGGQGQLDRIFKYPDEKREESLKRITRNTKIHFAVFYKADQLKLKTIYELAPEIVLSETRAKLANSNNDISHVGFSIKWARTNGKVVYEDAQ